LVFSPGERCTLIAGRRNSLPAKKISQVNISLKSTPAKKILLSQLTDPEQ